MNILGLNAYHGDSSAAIIVDGQLVAAVEEERFLRVKHWAGFPKESIKYCLREAGIGMEDVDYIALNRNILANLHKKIIFIVKKRPGTRVLANRLTNLLKISGIKKALCREFDITRTKVKIFEIEHQLMLVFLLDQEQQSHLNGLFQHHLFYLLELKTYRVSSFLMRML